MDSMESGRAEPIDEQEVTAEQEPRGALPLSELGDRIAELSAYIEAGERRHREMVAEHERLRRKTPPQDHASSKEEEE